MDHIVDCLESLRLNKAIETSEILVVDGLSTDGTRSLVSQFALDHRYVRLVDNPAGTKPAALNIGINEARGKYIMRVDAHCTYAPAYVDRLLEAISSRDVENVGGLQLAVVDDDGVVAQAIAVAVSHPLAMGNAVHRLANQTRERLVETVFCGCYPRRVFDNVGLFNESLLRTQDREFNKRLAMAGGKILLLPDVHAYYRPRTRLTTYCRWVYEGARWLFLAGKFTNVGMLEIRNYAPLAFVTYLVIALAMILLAPADATSVWLVLVPLALYLALVVVGGVTVAAQGRRLSLAVAFPAVVVLTHMSYGVGSAAGILTRLIGR